MKREEGLRKHVEVYDRIYSAIYSAYKELDDHALTVYYKVPRDIRCAEQEVRRDFFRRLWKKVFNGRGGQICLDCGCGEGLVLSEIAALCEKPPCFLGSDISKALLRQASKRCKEASFALSPGELLPIRSNSVDVVLCSHMLEHVHDAETVVSEVWRVLKPNGLVVVVAPREEWMDPIWGMPPLRWLVKLARKHLEQRREAIKRAQDEYRDSLDRSLIPPDRAMDEVELTKLFGDDRWDMLLFQKTSANFDWILYRRISKSLLRALVPLARILNRFPLYWCKEYVLIARKRL